MALTTLVARQPAGTRLQVLALSAVACAALLQPKSLGLPPEVDGIPFVMSLVFCQIIVVCFMLVVTAYQLSLTSGVGERTEQYVKSRRAALVKEWRGAFAEKRALDKQMPGGARSAMGPDTVVKLPAAFEAMGSSARVLPPSVPQTPVREFGEAKHDPITLLTQAVLALPALMHHAVQSTMPKPTHPYGEGAMGAPDWIRPEDKKLLERSERIDKTMTKVQAARRQVLTHMPSSMRRSVVCACLAVAGDDAYLLGALDLPNYHLLERGDGSMKGSCWVVVADCEHVPSSFRCSPTMHMRVSASGITLQ